MRGAGPLLTAAGASLLLLGGCALQPVYGGGGSSAAAQTLGSIQVSLIEDRAGYLVRQALLDRLAAAPDGESRYRLDVALDDEITGRGIRSDVAITRERRTLRARWQLVDTQTDITLIDTTSRSDAGIDVVSSQYAVVAAESEALDRLSREIADQIIARISTYALAEAR